MQKLAKLFLLTGTLSLSSCGLHGTAMDSLLGEESTSEKLFYPKRSSSEEKTSRPAYDSSYNHVDIDLTTYSETMAYATALDIGENYGQYRGKTMKAKGLFRAYESTLEGVYFYACAIMDVTACCAVEFEFIPRNNMNYPADFPTEDSAITVAGVFDPYTEEYEGNTYIYCNLSDAIILK